MAAKKVHSDSENHSGPQFVRFFADVLDAVRELGGSATAKEVRSLVLKKRAISDAELAETTKVGVPRVVNQIDWARFYLTKAGFLESPKRGIWALTVEGRTKRLTPATAVALFRDLSAQFNAERPDEGDLNDDGAEVVEVAESVEASGDMPHRAALLQRLKTLEPAAFERLCSRFLRLVGFENVETTGGPHDGGIDGVGTLRINPLLSMIVCFQCKRYDKPVGSKVVRDFRGSMDGRAEKGIIITTAAFSRPAVDEANRSGAQPIDLVDGERLCELFEQYEIGLKNKRLIPVYDLDTEFFESI